MRRGALLAAVQLVGLGAKQAGAGSPAALQQCAAQGLRGWGIVAGALAARAGAGPAAAQQLRTGFASLAARAAQQQAGGAVNAVRAAQQLQQARGVRHITFPARGGSGWGRSSWGGGDWDANRVLWGLIAANGAVFLLWRVNPQLARDHFTVSIESLRQGRVWTALTAAFSHADFMHFAANMIGLYFFGQDIGRLFGGRKLLALYLAGGLVGSLAHCGWYFYQACKHNQGRYGRRHFFAYAPPALGASAAVNSVMVVDILLFPSRTILLYGIIPVPAALLGVLWLARDVTGTLEGKGHIAHAGHLGGAALGLAFYVLFRRGRIRPKGWS